VSVTSRLARDARRDAAESLLAAALASHEASVRVLYLQTVAAYFNLLTAQAAITAIPVDHLQAKTLYTQRQIERIRAEGTAARLQVELAALMGDAAQTHFSVVDNEWAFSQTPDMTNKVDALIETASSRRPELRAAEATLQAREAGVQRAKADGMPRLSAFVNAQRQDFDSLAANSSSLGLSLTIPLFTGYYNTYQIAAAQTQAALAAVDLDSVKSQVALDVWQVYHRLHTETAVDSRSADLVESAAAAEKLALRRYQAGLGILLDVLSAQASLAQSIGELSWEWMEPAEREGAK
jgi:outer membrane protein